ncbi:MAG: DNA translocase FtsK 4TM domain-containing protein [Lachnospiraceae bacterium]
MLLFLSNFHICGFLGNFFSQIMLGVFGCIGYLAPLLLFAELLFYASNKGNIRAVYKMIAVEVLLIVLCGLAQLIFGGGYQEGQTILDIYQSAGASGLGGGVIGGVLVMILHTAVGTIGAYVVLIVFMIISLVCITERSFVSAVKSGSGKAYQYAKEDYSRRKEIHEERQAEKRRLREEQRVQGVNLAATDFSKNPDFGGIAGGYMGVVDAEAVSETDVTEEKQAASGTYHEEKQGQRSEAKQMQPDPADIFKGKITMGGCPLEEADVSREERTANPVRRKRLQRIQNEFRLRKLRHRPEPVRTRTCLSVMGRMPLMIRIFSRMRRRGETEAWERKPKVSVLSNIPDIPVGESGEDDEILAAMRRDAERKAKIFRSETLEQNESAENREPSEMPETVSAEGGQEIKTETGAKSGEMTAAAAESEPVSVSETAETPKTSRISEEKSVMDLTDDELLDTEPYVENDDYWIQAAAEPGSRAYRAAHPESAEHDDPVTEFHDDSEPDEWAEETSPSKVQEIPGPGPGPEDPIVEPAPAASGQSDMEQPTCREDRSPDRPAARESADDRRRVVTASGKVIETDTEEIIKKKAEARKREAAEREEAGNEVLKEIKQTEEKPKKPYVIPPLDLLKKGVPVTGQSEQEFKDTAIKLQQTLRNFGVGVTVTNISCGPTVTRYELHPEQGVKVSRILSLADDIKLNLAAADIRIEAPIPGKAAVGIEVPNKVNSIVYLRDLLESPEFKNHKSTLAFAVGKDIGGQVVVADLAKMPHLLIAGQTGSGKSVGINTMIMSLIYRSSPDDVKLIMIDPKVVELSVYNGIPHLLIPVVTDPKKAAGALNWAVVEMMDRYNKFAASNVRDLKGYNAKVQTLAESGDIPADQIPKKLPQLVIIIDELADLMMVASNEVEDAICRLAQLARAAGIHLVIATQRPSVNVITGVIKANVPSRIAFSVASGVDSRTILDMNGAEKLLGNGDMLFYPSGYPKPLRVQGAFVSDGEVSNVTEFLKEQNTDAGYNTEIEKKLSQSSFGGGAGGQNERDALFTDAGKFIIEKDKASIGMLQRMFKIGFNRAARIMDQLAEAGVVGEEEGTKPRKILMSMEEFEEFLEAGY